MGNLGDGLMDNGSLIEIGGSVVGGCSDQFYTLFVGLVIGLRSSECRQERVVDIDYGLPKGIQEDAREDLHVSSHDNELDVVFL